MRKCSKFRTDPELYLLTSFWYPKTLL